MKDCFVILMSDSYDTMYLNEKIEGVYVCDIETIQNIVINLNQQSISKYFRYERTKLNETRN